MRELDLQHVDRTVAAELCDQGAHPGRDVAAHLPGQSSVLRKPLVDIHDIDFVEDFVQFVEFYVIVLLAESSQNEIHPIGERTGKVVDPHRAAVRERVGKVRREDCDPTMFGGARPSFEHPMAFLHETAFQLSATGRQFLCEIRRPLVVLKGSYRVP